MARIKSLSITGFILAWTVSFLALAAAPPSAGMSVGDFAVMIAAKLPQPNHSQDAASTESAVQKLAKAGISLKSNPTAPLTAGDAAEIFRQFGITLQAEHPESALSRERAQVLVNTFSDTLNIHSSSSASTPSTVQHPTSQAGISVGIEALEDCQSLPKNRDCHDCCLAMGLPKNVCGRACNNGKKASGSEPTP
jgi:hypothetical protein